VDICSKISDEEKVAWINATMALQQDPNLNMAVVTMTPEVRHDLDDYLNRIVAHEPF
jgi:hypothetical protein